MKRYEPTIDYAISAIDHSVTEIMRESPTGPYIRHDDPDLRRLVEAAKIMVSEMAAAYGAEWCMHPSYAQIRTALAAFEKGSE